MVSMVCPQRSAPSVCAPSARRALGSARPQLSTPLASAPSVQEPRSVLVCRRPVVFVMCSLCAVCPWWALSVCALGQVRPRPSAPSARRSLTSARPGLALADASSVQESISLCPTGAGPCGVCHDHVQRALGVPSVQCALGACALGPACLRLGVPSAKRALS